MKKLLIILFASFYLMLASGLSLSLHYCGGKLKSVSLFSSASDDGCCGKKMKSKDCCNDTETFFKVNDNHFASNTVKILNSPVKSISEQVFRQLFEIQNTGIACAVLNYYPPPVLFDNPIYLKYRVLII